MESIIKNQLSNPFCYQEMFRRGYLFCYLFIEKFKVLSSEDQIKVDLSNFMTECYEENKPLLIGVHESLTGKRNPPAIAEINLIYWEELCRYLILGNGELELNISKEVLSNAVKDAKERARVCIATDYLSLKVTS
mgnify:CR=1 FL=1